jgi:hypothetical protein
MPSGIGAFGFGAGGSAPEPELELELEAVVVVEVELLPPPFAPELVTVVPPQFDDKTDREIVATVTPATAR